MVLCINIADCKVYNKKTKKLENIHLGYNGERQLKNELPEHLQLCEFEKKKIEFELNLMQFNSCLNFLEELKQKESEVNINGTK